MIFLYFLLFTRFNSSLFNNHISHPFWCKYIRSYVSFSRVCMVCLLEGCYMFLGCSGYVWKIMIVGIMLKMKNCTDTLFTRNGWVIQPNPSEINTHIIMVSWNLNHTNQVSHSLTVRQNHKKLRGHENMKITSYYCHDLLIDFLCCLNWNFLKGKYFVGNNELCEELIILVFIPSSFCYNLSMLFHSFDEKVC